MMRMDEDLYKVRNRETLRLLDMGMEITRATKHEPIDFSILSGQELRDATDDRSGSKFLREWTLRRLVNWLEVQVRGQGWRFPPGVRTRLRVRLAQPVGYVAGKLVQTITVTASGRWVHAYPDKDEL
jgi:hypothetical protein